MVLGFPAIVFSQRQQLLIKGQASLPMGLLTSQWSHIPAQRAELPDHASLPTGKKRGQP